MSRSSEQEPKGVRIIINGEEVDPNNLPPNLIKPKKGDKGGKDKKGSSGCSSLIGCLIGFVIVASIGCGVMAAVSAIFNINIPFMNTLMTAFTGIEAEKTEPIKTDASNFDPFVGLAQAQELAGPDAELISISALYVRSDGTMDLHASYNPSVDYEFIRKIPRPENAPPVGVAGSTNGQWYEPITIDAYRPGTRRSVSITSGGSRVSYSYVNEGMVRDVDSPTTTLPGKVIPAPRCTMQELWETALRKDAPADAVAIIDYDEEGYSFNISGVLYLNFTVDCKLKDS